MHTPQAEDRAFAQAHMNTVLARLAGPGATPRPDQVDAVHAVLQPASRVLVVQATGWGKSAGIGRPRMRFAARAQALRWWCRLCWR